LQAAGAVLSTTARFKIYNCEAIKKVFESTVLNSFSGSVAIWGLRYSDLLEKIQVSFLKRLLLLPSTTSGALLRIETGYIHLSYLIFKLSLNFLLKLLKMDENRLPKICFKRQVTLLSNSSPHLNWALTLKIKFQELGFENL